MHRKNTHRWSKLFSAASIVAVLFGGLVSQSVRAVSTNPAPVCVGATCSVTFEYTGDYYFWTPPTGAKNLTFDLMGGQGGRVGGLGGRVQGSIPTMPASLYIYVAGAGSQGNSVAGGFNGGGAAGSGRADEGSGGGATDIRITTALADRLVVAAGGGGSGGFSGGVGGNGGGLNGNAGVTGQGQGGSGATQTAGGSGGYPNGGSWGANGQLANGGAGGSSTVSGGGGGGGGLYGGGGGGADIDSCCTNGGGGGGGSSFANATVTSSVTHTAGYRSGNGVAILTYVMPPQVTTFAPALNLTNTEPVNYNLVFNQAVTGLTNADFVTTDSTDTCSTIAVSGSGTTYSVAVSGCTDGVLKLTLIADAVLGTLTGPALAAAAAPVTIDRVAPTATVAPAATTTNAATVQFNLVANEPITDLTALDLTITGLGCGFGSVSGSGTAYVVNVTGCADGASAAVNLAANSIKDAAGNLGPVAARASAVSTIDRTPPVFSIANPSSPTAALSMSYVFTANKSVTDLAVNDFTITGSGCSVSAVSGSGSDYLVTVTGCADSVSVWLTMKANSVQDFAGNWGPAAATATAGAVIIGVRPVVAPTPTASASASPSASPSVSPSLSPSAAPSASPTVTVSPTVTASPAPVAPTAQPAPQDTGASAPVAPVAAPSPVALPKSEPTKDATDPSADVIDLGALPIVPVVSGRVPPSSGSTGRLAAVGSATKSYRSAIKVTAADLEADAEVAGSADDGLFEEGNSALTVQAEGAQIGLSDSPTLRAGKPGIDWVAWRPLMIGAAGIALVLVAAALAIRVVKTRRRLSPKVRRLVPLSD